MLLQEELSRGEPTSRGEGTAQTCPRCPAPQAAAERRQERAREGARPLQLPCSRSGTQMPATGRRRRRPSRPPPPSSSSSAALVNNGGVRRGRRGAGSERAARCCRAGRDRWQVLRAGLPTRLRASSAKFAGGRRRKPRRDCSSRAGDVADQPPLSGGAAATPLNPRWPPARPPGRLFLRGLKGPSRPPLRGSPLPGVRSGSSEFCPLLPPGLRRAVLPRSQLRRCRPPAPRRPGGSVPAAPAASTAA